MADSIIPNSGKADLAIPADKAVTSVRVRVTVDPPTGAVLIYGGPGYDAPVRFAGPQSEGEVPTNSRTVYIQGIDGAAAVKVYTLSWMGA